jgi:ParB family chromosome partitioning protein
MMKTAQNPQFTADLDEATAVAVNRELWGNTKPRGAQGTGKFEWYTPRKYIGAVRAVLGEIDLDPASSEIAQRTVRAAKYFTIDDDGLSQDWHGRAFLNPPYAQPLTERFVAKLIAEHEAGHVSEAILLTHNFTCTRWCQDALWACRAFCHTRGRIKFIDPDGELANKPTQGQTFFYFGHRPEVFAAVFADIGFVALGWAGQAMMLEAAE